MWLCHASVQNIMLLILGTIFPLRHIKNILMLIYIQNMLGVHFQNIDKLDNNSVRWTFNCWEIEEAGCNLVWQLRWTYWKIQSYLVTRLIIFPCDLSHSLSPSFTRFRLLGNPVSLWDWRRCLACGDGWVRAPGWYKHALHLFRVRVKR